MHSHLRNLVSIYLSACCFCSQSYCQSNFHTGNLRVVIIRHAEKPPKADNLTCQGLNRSLQLPAVLYSKFGVPKYTYVPSPGLGSSTKHARPFQTVIPLAVKYNLIINSKYDERDSKGIAADIKNKEGTVLVVWEHHVIPSIVRSLGVPNFNLTWDEDDYDSIWIITFQKGTATISIDKEALAPSLNCPN
jgi:hypothetical protein